MLLQKWPAYEHGCTFQGEWCFLFRPGQGWVLGVVSVSYFPPLIFTLHQVSFNADLNFQTWDKDLVLTTAGTSTGSCIPTASTDKMSVQNLNNLNTKASSKYMVYQYVYYLRPCTYNNAAEKTKISKFEKVCSFFWWGKCIRQRYQL